MGCQFESSYKQRFFLVKSYLKLPTRANLWDNLRELHICRIVSYEADIFCGY